MYFIRLCFHFCAVTSDFLTVIRYEEREKKNTCVCVHAVFIYMCESLVWFLLFNGIFNTRAIITEEQKWYCLTHSWEDKGVHTFPKGICSKVNIIARLGYELTYYESADQCFMHYTTKPLPMCEYLCAYITIRYKRNDKIKTINRHVMKDNILKYKWFANIFNCSIQQLLQLQVRMDLGLMAFEIQKRE